MTRVAFDLDDVLGDHTEQFILFNDRVYPRRRRLHLEQFRSYDFSSTLDISSDDLYGRLNRFYESQEFAAISPTPNSQKYISRLTEEGNEIFVLTSRPRALGKITRNWVKEYFPEVVGILITGELLPGPENLKGRICKKRGFHVILEDSLIQALDCANYVGVGLVDKPWNRNIPVTLPKNITRVESWEGIYKLVQKY